MKNTLIIGFADPARPAQSLNLRDSSVIAERLNLNEAHFELGAHPESIFAECNLSKSNMSWTFLDKSKFIKSVLISVNFTNSELGECVYEDCVIHAACFDNANLEGTCFTGTQVHACSFKGANLKNTVFRLKDWSKLDVRGAKYNKSTVWPAGFDPITQGAILEA